MADTILSDLDAPPEAATAKRARRKISDTQRRRTFIVFGVLLASLSVAGFYFTAAAFDNRVPVLVAAVDIAAGETITSAHLTSVEAQVDAVPHIRFSPESASLFEGSLAAQSIPAGALLREDMTIAPLTQPVGDQLELQVPLDISLAKASLHPGEEVLLIDPGQQPNQDDPGRPRKVLEALTLRDFDGTNMRLLLPPEDWAAWRTALTALGTNPMVLSVPLGGDPAEFAQRLDAVWHAEHANAVKVIADSQLAAGESLSAGPGELEVVVELDTSLVPSGIEDGDRALIIDPGVEPTVENQGRPRKIVNKTVITNYKDGRMRLFLPPAEWIYWERLSRDLGTTPMVLVVPTGTDETELVDVLETEWAAAYQHALRIAYLPEGNRIIATDVVEDISDAE